MEAFLNANFASLDDLDSIDKVISTIHQRTQDISKENAGGTRNPTNSWKRIAQIAGDIRNQLEGIVKSDDIDKLNSLIEKYGDLSPLLDVRKQMIEKSRLLLLKDVCSSCLKIQDGISHLNELDVLDDSNYDKQLGELRSVYEQVKQYYNEDKQNEVQYTSEVTETIKSYKQQLFTHLSCTIASKFKPEVEKALKEEMKDFGIEKQKPIKSPLMKQINLHFTRLLELQKLDPVNNTPIYPNTVWAVDCVCSAFKVRFVYHFEGSTETNQLSKPEYALEYILGYLKRNQDLVRLTFGDTFHKYYPKILVEDSFITSVLAIARGKFIHDRTLCAENEKLLNHLVFELQKFDRKLAQDFNYHQIMGREEWPGLTYDLILSDEQIFTKWLDDEKRFVNHRYDEIMNSNDAFSIDYGFVEEGQTQPTKSAENLTNLFDGITLSYEDLPLKYQLKFLSDVQLKLLNFYYEILSQGLNALDSVKRTDDISYIERLCRIWCSAKFMIGSMQKWGEKPIFVELWNAINPNNNCVNTFFDSVISGYQGGVLNKIPERLRKHVERQLNRTMKEYFQSNISWSNLDHVDSQCQELQLPIETLRKDLNFLRRCLFVAEFRSSKQIFSEVIATYFEKNFIWCNTFSRQGASQLKKHLDMFYDSLSLIKDYKHYYKITEMLDVLVSDDIDYSHYHVISMKDISDVKLRRA